MVEESEKSTTEEQLKQQLINKVKELIKRDGEIFTEKPPIRFAAYNVNLAGFSPSDPNIKLRLLGPVSDIRLILFERENDGSVQLQAHAHYPLETQVLSLELSEQESPKLSEYKVVYSRGGRTPLSTTPVPILDITENTLHTFIDLVNRGESVKQ